MPPPRGEFVAMSVFFYAMHCLHDLGPAELPSWPNPSLAEIRSATEAFCAMDWKAMMHEDEAAVSKYQTYLDDADVNGRGGAWGVRGFRDRFTQYVLNWGGGSPNL